MIILKNIHKTYFGKGVETKVLKGINMEIGYGDYICIHGKSGSGKSTLLNILAGIDKPDSGVYEYDNSNIQSFTYEQLAEFRNKKIGYIFQDFKLLNQFTVLDNIGMPLGYGGVSSEERIKKSLEMLNMVGISDLQNKYPDELSGGEKQRVAIARALVNKPRLILADEPTGNLDESTGIEIMNCIESMIDSMSTLIIVSHDEEIKKRAKKSYHIVDGIIKNER